MDEIYVLAVNDYRDYLEHHGVKGQKWGERNAEWYPIEAYRRSKGLSGPGPYKATAKTSGGSTQAIRTQKRAKGTMSQEEINRAYADYRNRNGFVGFLNRTEQKISESRAKRQAEKEAAEKKKAQEERLQRAREAKAAKKAAEEAEEKARVEKEEFERKKKETFSHGTVDEILQYVNKADSQEIVNAINRRKTLDAIVSENTQTTRSVGKLEKIISNVSDKVTPIADKAVPLAKKIGDVADSVTNAITKSEKAYDTAKRALVRAGLISPEAAKSTDAVVRAAKKYQASQAYAQYIYDEFSKGNIKPSDLGNYEKSYNSLKKIESAAIGPKESQPKPAETTTEKKPSMLGKLLGKGQDKKETKSDSSKSNEETKSNKDQDKKNTKKNQNK